MEGLSPERQGKKIGLFTVVFVGVVFVLLFFLVLNYFNILPVSSLWAPRKAQPTPTIPKLTPTPFRISCPSIKEFCDKGEDIFKGQKYFGLGYKLSSESAIFAAFDGNLTSTVSSYFENKNGVETQKKYIIVNLANEDLNMKAIYLFRGEVIKDGKVNKGEQIAISSGKKISIYNNNSIVFSINKLYGSSEDALLLNKEYFK